MDTYTVKQGDTLRKLAKQFGKTVEEFASANAIENPNFIKVGQELVIPGQTFISTQGQAVPATQSPNIDMASVPENVPTVPEKRDEIVPTPTEVPTIQTTEQPKATQDPLIARQTQLQEEIKAMEEAMAKRTAVRTEELDVAGVFADMRKRLWFCFCLHCHRSMSVHNVPPFHLVFTLRSLYTIMPVCCDSLIYLMYSSIRIMCNNIHH